jgi:uncharacterized membrane protein YhaH (DUF805 family)
MEQTTDNQQFLSIAFSRKYLKYIFFTNEGRIGRKQYAFGILLIFMLQILLTLSLSSLTNYSSKIFTEQITSIEKKGNVKEQLSVARQNLSKSLKEQPASIIFYNTILNTLAFIFSIFILILILSLLIGFFNVVIKRLHDINISAIACIIILLPIINILFILVLAIIESENNDNEYGNKPLI